MRRQTGRVVAAVFFTVLASPCFGQIAGVVQSSSSSRLSFNAPGCPVNGQAEPPVQSQPYTAELKTTTVQTLANGATITRISTEVHAVDSQKRTFNSSTQTQFSADQPEITWATVNDPVENTQANWNSQTKTAQVLKLPPEAQRHGCWASDSGNTHMNYGPETPQTPAEAAAMRERIKTIMAASPQRPSVPTMEDLGTTTIEGVEVQGQRWTSVIRVGQIGNDRELINTSENWFAPSLGLNLRTLSDSLQGGKTTTEVTRLDLSEPPLATFQPPEGYEVTVEELHQVPCETRQMSGFGGGIGVVRGGSVTTTGGTGQP